MADFYSLLDVSENASEEDIRKAYRRMAKQFHPDVNKSHDAQARFVMINKAYEVLMDRQKRFAYDQKNKTTADPFYFYARWAQEQQARQEAEARRRQKDFLRKKEQIRESKLYYPYMMALYMTSMVLMGLSVLVLVACAFVILKYHVFMFFFLLPFICGAAYVLKVTLDGYRKYKALFS
jgi:curved DNA-binding protein CbpA